MSGALAQNGQSLHSGPSLKKPLRWRLRNGEVLFGPFMKLASPQIVEIVGRTGFDFVILDTEHAPLDFESVENLVRAADGVKLPALVRVYENSPSLISRSLDVGAEGILVPHISSGEEARALSRAARFAPDGERGICRYVRAAGFSGMDRYAYFEEANRNTLVVAIVEGKEGIANLDEVLSTPGLDVVFIGPYDLSQSLGVVGQVDNPEVVRVVQHLVERARSFGVAVGTFADDAMSAMKWAQNGVQFVAYSVDVGIIYDAMKSAVAEVRFKEAVRGTL